jgi:hypothetical protein
MQCDYFLISFTFQNIQFEYTCTPTPKSTTYIEQKNNQSHLISIGDFNENLSRFRIRIFIWMTDLNRKQKINKSIEIERTPN